MERKEAIEVVKKNWPDSSFTRLREALETLIPELKESEDERIREEIKVILANTDLSQFALDYTFADMLTWLEKQGEQKPILDFKAADWYVSKVDGKIHNIHQSVDKVEPKFKVGDWITDGNITIQIEAVKNNCYLYCGDCALYSTKTADKAYHLWTIQDAKDGDVLWHSDSASNGIFIFKEIRYDGKVLCYCDYDSEDHFCIGEHHTCCWSNAKYIKPATKEQRDTLEKAMTDAGYIFDFDKKELKKIEQKYTPKHKVGDTIYYNSFGEVKSMIVSNVITDDSDVMYEDEDGNDVFEKDLIEQNTVWSEEGEDYINDLIKYFSQNEGLKNTKEDIVIWLKSLKDRIQPKQEWSEEDEVTRNALINLVEMYYGGCIDKSEKNRLLNFLNSIRSQSQWKPSDEQMIAIQEAMNIVGILTITGSKINSLYQDLKKLRKK